MKHQHISIETRRKVATFWLIIASAVFAATVVAGMIYFTYSISPKRL